MANVILIMGSSGTGKSTSLKTLKPEETVVFNILGKRLPFKGSNSQYNAEKKNLFNVDSYDKIVQFIQSIDKNATYIKNIIVDDEFSHNIFAYINNFSYIAALKS